MNKTLPIFREGESLRIEREIVSFGRNIILPTKTGFALQHRLFVNDPWAIISERIHRALPKGRNRDLAHSFEHQAEDYFRAAAAGREMAVLPVLLYYAFLNLSKAYALSKGNLKLAGKSSHGVSAAPKPQAIPGSLIKFEVPSANKPGVFQELLKHLGGNSAVMASDLKVGYLLPQILPGHRLWCYAAKRVERFLPVEHFQVRHSSAKKHVWLNIFLNAGDLERLGITVKRALHEAGLATEFEFVKETSVGNVICLQQITPVLYSADPPEALALIVGRMRNRIWETVKTASPYRKSYIYCCPTPEQRARLPQMLSVYLLMFFLSSVTRYVPGYFEDLLDSKYGPLFETFIGESSMQFLYLMASDILGREVSKPAII